LNESSFLKLLKNDIKRWTTKDGIHSRPESENVFGWVQEGDELNFIRFFLLKHWKHFSQTENL